MDSNGGDDGNGNGNGSKEDSDRSNGTSHRYCWHIWRILSWCYCCGHCEQCCSKGCECYRCKHVKEEVKGKYKDAETEIEAEIER